MVNPEAMALILRHHRTHLSYKSIPQRRGRGNRAVMRFEGGHDILSKQKFLNGTSSRPVRTQEERDKGYPTWRECRILKKSQNHDHLYIQ
jgi:hypothetical protein